MLSHIDLVLQKLTVVSKNCEFVLAVFGGSSKNLVYNQRGTNKVLILCHLWIFPVITKQRKTSLNHLCTRMGTPQNVASEWKKRTIVSPLSISSVSSIVGVVGCGIASQLFSC